MDGGLRSLQVSLKGTVGGWPFPLSFALGSEIDDDPCLGLGFLLQLL